MKKILKIIIVILGAGALSYGAYFYYQNLRGIGPVVKNPSKDIVKEIEKTQNTTEMPLKLPDGFSISIYAKGLGGPRVMARDPKGNFLVSEPSQGRVLALVDEDSDGFAEKHVIVVSGLNKPHGLASRCVSPDPEESSLLGVSRFVCKLYVAEEDKLVQYEYDETNLKAVNGVKLADIPAGGNHVTRTLLFMPYPNENKLLVSVGSTCNACIESNPQRAKILVYDFETGKLSEFARGLRNSVFMAIHPVTGSIWATEMGRDLIGDDIPPDEINILQPGKWYGWPWFYGKNVEDYNFSPNARPSFAEEPVPSHIDLQAHSAPLGLAFIPEEGWPEEMWHNLLVAYHGSWNKTVPTGYKIVRFKLDAKGKVLGEAEDFITGWLSPGQSKDGALGRPVDIIVEPDGKIYISDDKAGVIYLVRSTK